MIGVPLGILIGIITGLVVVLLIRTAWKASLHEARTLLTLIVEFLAIPAFWFSGSWIGGNLFSGIDLSDILPEYMVSLAVSFVGISLYPLLKIVRSVGQEIGKMEKTGDT